MNSPLPWWRRDLLIGILLVCVPVLLALPMTTKNIPLSQGDYISQYYIWQSYFVKEIRHFHVPIWNPWVFGGTPFFANPQTALLSPFSWLLIPFQADHGLPGTIFDLRTAVITGLGGLGIFLWLRLWLPKLPAVFGSLFWMVSPIGLWLYRDSTTALSVVAVWPFWLLAIDHWIKTHRRLSLFLFSVAVAMAWLAGHPPMFVASSIGIGMYCLIRLRPDRTNIRPVVVAFLVGCGLAAVQLIPAIQFVMQTTQTSSISKNALPAVTALGGLTSLFSPSAYQYLPVTIGLVGLLLMFVAWHGSQAAAKTWAAFTLFSSLFVLFVFAFLPSLDRVPALHNLVRYPWRLMFIPFTGMVALAAFGLVRWAEVLTAHQRRIQLTLVFFGTLAVFLTLTQAPATAGMITAGTTIAVLWLSRYPKFRWAPTIIGAIGILALFGSWSRAMVTNGPTWNTIHTELRVLASAPNTGDRIDTGGSHLLANGSMLYARPNIRGYDSLVLKSYIENINPGPRSRPARWVLTPDGWVDQGRNIGREYQTNQPPSYWLGVGAMISLLTLGFAIRSLRSK